MTKLLKLFSFLLLCGYASAQSTTVSGNVTDLLGNVWINARVIFQFQPTPGIPGPYTWSGGALNLNPQTMITDGSGNFSISLPSNTSIVPSLSSYLVSVCPDSTIQCVVFQTPVSGATFNITALITANFGTNKVAATFIAKAYADNMVGVIPLNEGAMLYNTTLMALQYWNGSIWQTLGTGSPGCTASNCIVTNPIGPQTITQPLNTNFSLVTSGTGQLLYNGSLVLSVATGVQLNPTTSQTITQPVSTALHLVGSTTFTNTSGLPVTSMTYSGLFNTTTDTPNLYLQGGFLRSDLVLPASFSHEDALTIGQSIPAGSTAQGAFGIGVFQNNPGSSPTNPVGYYAQSNAGFNGTTIWGINTNLQDSDVPSRGGTAHTGVTEFNEFDCNANSTTTAGACIFINGNFTATPTNLGMFHGAFNVGGGHWAYGITLDDGATTGFGLQLGSLMLTANSQSQAIFQNWRDGSNTRHTLNLFAGADASYTIQDTLIARQNLRISNGGISVDSGGTPNFATGSTSGSVTMANGSYLYSPTAANNVLVPLIRLNSGNTIDLDPLGQGIVTGGAMNAHFYVVNGVAGVSCSGIPTASFAVTNGIVTHC